LPQLQTVAVAVAGRPNAIGHRRKKHFVKEFTRLIVPVVEWTVVEWSVCGWTFFMHRRAESVAFICYPNPPSWGPH